MENELPEGWKLGSISDLFDVNPGHREISISDEAEVTFLPMTLIQEKVNKIDVSNTKAYKNVKSGFTKFIEGDVLFAKITPCMENGKIAIAKGLKNGIGCGTTELHVFRPIKLGTNKLLYYFLVQEKFREYAKSNFHGAVGHLRVPTSIFKENIYPIPPLAEQTRIVAKLDTAFGHVETLKMGLARIPELLKKFRQTVLIQAVTGKLTEEWREGKLFDVEGEVSFIKKARFERYRVELEKSADQISRKPKKIKFEECNDESFVEGWKSLFIEEIFDVETGGTPKRDVKKYWENATIPWIKSGQVSNKDILEADEFITNAALFDTNAKVYPYNSILIAMYGEGKTRGQVGILKFEATSNQAIAAMVNPSLPETTIKFVFYFGLSQYEEIRKEAAGGNQPNLNTGKIKEWKIDFPPLEEQQEIVNRVEALFAKADALEAQYVSLKAKIDKLPQALLAKAFRGELVPQNPTDEPASVLLEKIRGATATVGGKKRNKAAQTTLAFMAE